MYDLPKGEFLYYIGYKYKYKFIQTIGMSINIILLDMY